MDYSTAQAGNTELRLGKHWKLLVCLLSFIAEREGKLPAALDNYRRELAAQPANELLRKHIHELEAKIGNSSKNE